MCERKSKAEKVPCNVLDPGILRTFPQHSTAGRKNSALEVLTVGATVTLIIIFAEELVSKNNWKARCSTL